MDSLFNNNYELYKLYSLHDVECETFIVDISYYICIATNIVIIIYTCMHAHYVSVHQRQGLNVRIFVLLSKIKPVMSGLYGNEQKGNQIHV